MTKKLILTGPTLPRIHDTSKTLPRLDISQVAAALGAELAAERIEHSLSPPSLLAVRNEVYERLKSTGGRPALSGATRRTKVPLGDAEWAQLEQLAKSISSPGFAPSAGQVASVLVSISLQTIAKSSSRTTKKDKLRPSQKNGPRIGKNQRRSK